MIRKLCELHAEFPCTPEAIENFCGVFRQWRSGICARLDAFGSELLLREALTNSVRHACRDNAGKHVRCVLRVRPGRILIAVEDEGCGFDWRAMWRRQSAPSDVQGRGLELFRHYASRVRFSPRGNAVILIKRF